MNIIIKDMEMPQNCYFCWLGHKCPKYESLLWNETDKKRKADCPLVEIPPHGDLIDRNALMQHEVLLPMDGGHLPVIYASYVHNTPAIIKADESNMDSFIRIFEEDNEEDGMDSFIRILKD